MNSAPGQTFCRHFVAFGSVGDDFRGASPTAWSFRHSVADMQHLGEALAGLGEQLMLSSHSLADMALSRRDNSTLPVALATGAMEHSTACPNGAPASWV